jgi:hypothetical protein
MGGKIRLSKGDSTLELALTNYHVVKDALGNLSEANPPDVSPPYKDIISPSDSDHETAIHNMQAYLEILESTYTGLSEKLGLLPEDDPRWEKQSADTKDILQEIKEQKRKLERVKQHPRYLGRIYAASGFQTSGNPRVPGQSNWALDWCLVRMNSGISSEIQNVPSTKIPKKAEVTQYCSFPNNVNFYVVKRGRTTDWTQGKLSAIKSTVRLDDRSLPEPAVPTNQEIRFKDQWGGEAVQVHAIIGTMEEPRFIKPGDSGSFVLLDSLTDIPGVSIIGLGFAGNEACLASYMIPMDLVVEDIERVTGGKVIEPRNAGMAVAS